MINLADFKSYHEFQAYISREFLKKHKVFRYRTVKIDEIVTRKDIGKLSRVAHTFWIFLQLLHRVSSWNQLVQLILWLKMYSVFCVKVDLILLHEVCDVSSFKIFPAPPLWAACSEMQVCLRETSAYSNLSQKKKKKCNLWTCWKENVSNSNLQSPTNPERLIFTKAFSFLLCKENVEKGWE